MEQPNIIVKEALRTAVKAINSGDSPTRALKKAAEEYDLTPAFVHRVGEAINVALHHSHFKKASDKAAEFALADIERVAAEILMTNEKTAAETKSEWFPSTELSRTIPDYTKLVDNPRYKKAYCEVIDSGANAQETKFAPTAKHVMEKASHYIRNLKKTLENARVAKVAADTKLDRSYAVLVNHFSKTAHVVTPWHEIETQVFAKIGEAAVPYLNLVYETAGLKEDRGLHKKACLSEPCVEVSLFEGLMKRAGELNEADENLKVAQANYDFEKAEYDDIFKKAEVKKNDETPVVPAPVVEKEAEVEPMIDEDIEKIGNTVLDMLMTRFQDSVDSKAKKPSNPMQNSSKDNLDRQTLIQDLIMTDPILSRENPRKVIAAYQQLLRISPQYSKEKEVVRSMLRAMMASNEGALDPHTANQWQEGDINLMKQRLTASGHQQGGK